MVFVLKFVENHIFYYPQSILIHIVNIRLTVKPQTGFLYSNLEDLNTFEVYGNSLWGWRLRYVDHKVCCTQSITFYYVAVRQTDSSISYIMSPVLLHTPRACVCGGGGDMTMVWMGLSWLECNVRFNVKLLWMNVKTNNYIKRTNLTIALHYVNIVYCCNTVITADL